MKIASKKERIINFIADFIFIVLFAIIVRLIISIFIDISDRMLKWILVLTIILYYTIFEWISGRTPGKIISYTKVVKMDNTKINLYQATFRSLIRLTGVIVPLSFLFGTDIGIHDLVTKTRVIIDKKEKEKSPAYNST